MTRRLAGLIFAVGLFVAACGGSEMVAPSAGSGPSAGAPIPGGGLSVQEAIDSTLEGPLMIKGYFVAVESQVPRLCSALLESYPPQCGDPSLAVAGLEISALEGLSRAGEPTVVWSETEISLLGTVRNGVLSVSPTGI